MIMAFINHVLTNAIFPGICFGVLCFIVSLFLPISPYKLGLQLLGVLLCIVFTFQAGRALETNKYEKQALIDKANQSQLEVKSAKGDVEIVIRYVDRIKTVVQIKEVKTNVYVTQEADSACVISDVTSGNVASLLNSAVTGKVPDSPRQVDGSPK